MVGGVLLQWLTDPFTDKAECGFKSRSQALIQFLFDSVEAHIAAL